MATHNRRDGRSGRPETAASADSAGLVGQQIRLPKTAELVAAQLRRQIVRGELAEGDALPPEATLMEQFGVSRPTLREAFRVLESERLITVRRGVHGGARVHAPVGDVAARYAALVLEYRGTTLADVYAARSIIEPPCMALLARRRTDADLAALRAALADTEAPEDLRVSVQAQLAFHALLIKLAGNQTLIVLADMLRHIIELATESRAAADGDSAAGRRAFRRAFRGHQRLLELIEAGNADEAQALWQKHLDEGEDYGLEGSTPMTVLDLLG